MPKAPLTIGAHQRPEHYGHHGQRKSASERGYDWRWAKYRADYLKQHPLCAHCLAENKVTPATDVDHIIKAVDRPDLFWEPTNHQGLCSAHHKRKTAMGS